MYRARTGSSDTSKLQDVIHIVIGVVIVVMAVFAFTDPAENMVLFPLIFFCAAFLHLANAVFAMREAGQGHGMRFDKRCLLPSLAGAALLLLGIVSAVNIW